MTSTKTLYCVPLSINWKSSVFVGVYLSYKRPYLGFILWQRKRSFYNLRAFVVGVAMFRSLKFEFNIELSQV